LRKRAGYRSAFQQFEPDRVARFNRRKIESLLRDPGIVRNRLKVESAVNNAGRILEVQQEFGSDARDLAVAMIASYQGIALLTNTFRQPELMVREARRLDRWIDSLA
jgi:DNA-3-methyladenine glycosylase I